MNEILQQRIEEAAREYLLKEHISPLNDIMHQADLNAEIQYHKDIENAFIRGCLWKQDQIINKAIEWLEPVFKDLAGYYCGGDLINDFKKAMEE